MAGDGEEGLFRGQGGSPWKEVRNDFFLFFIEYDRFVAVSTSCILYLCRVCRFRLFFLFYRFSRNFQDYSRFSSRNFAADICFASCPVFFSISISILVQVFEPSASRVLKCASL